MTVHSGALLDSNYLHHVRILSCKEEEWGTVCAIARSVDDAARHFWKGGPAARIPGTRTLYG